MKVLLSFLFMGSLFLTLGSRTARAQQMAPGGDKDKLSLILLGADSIATYVGSSDVMEGLRSGKISDSIYTGAIVSQVKRQDLDILIKPTAAGDVGRDLQNIITFLNTNDLQRRDLDTLDNNEQVAFRTTSAPQMEDWMSRRPLVMTLPKAGADSSKAPKPARSPQLIALLYGENGIYVYTGSDMSSGKKCSKTEFKELLAEKKSDNTFVLLIRPCKSGSYSNIVNVLDVVQQAGIEKYALVDITSPEEKFLASVR